MDKTGIWQMTNEEENAWIENVNENAAFRIKDHFKVRVGIKSCADNVFICQEWEKMGLHLEKELLRPMISQENIEAWHINKCSIKEILYPHYSENGQRKVLIFQNIRLQKNIWISARSSWRLENTLSMQGVSGMSIGYLKILNYGKCPKLCFRILV